MKLAEAPDEEWRHAAGVRDPQAARAAAFAFPLDALKLVDILETTSATPSRFATHPTTTTPPGDGGVGSRRDGHHPKGLVRLSGRGWEGIEDLERGPVPWPGMRPVGRLTGPTVLVRLARPKGPAGAGWRQGAAPGGFKKPTDGRPS